MELATKDRRHRILDGLDKIALQDISPNEVYRRGDLSRDKATRLPGMSLEAFLRHAKKLGIPDVDYMEDEWEAEQRSMQEIAASIPRSAPPARCL